MVSRVITLPSLSPPAHQLAHHAHGLADDVDESLVGNCPWVCDEEEAQGDVEERERGQDGLGRYERHGWSFLGLESSRFGWNISSLEREGCSEIPKQEAPFSR